MFTSIPVVEGGWTLKQPFVDILSMNQTILGNYAPVWTPSKILRKSLISFKTFKIWKRPTLKCWSSKDETWWTKWNWVTQYNKRYILSTFYKIEMFALSNRIFNKLSNDTKFLKFEVRLLEIQHLPSLYFLLLSLYFTSYCVHYLRINLADKMSLLLYWVAWETFSSLDQQFCPVNSDFHSSWIFRLDWADKVWFMSGNIKQYSVCTWLNKILELDLNKT